MSAGIEISKRLVVINSASSVLRSVMNLTVLFWVQRHLVRNVPAEEYQMLALIFPLLLFTPLLTMAVSGGLARFIIEAYAKGDLRRVTQICSTMFPLTLVAGGIVLLVGGLMTWKIESILNLEPQYTSDARVMFAILVARVGIHTILAPFMVGLDVKQKFLFRNILALFLDALRVALIFWLLFDVSTRVIWMVIATVPGMFIETGINLFYSRRLVPELRFDRREIRSELIRPITSFGGWTLVSRAASVAREMTGPFFLAHFSGVNYAIHVQAYRLGSYVETRFYPTVLAPLLTVQPALTGMFALGQEDRLRRTYFRIARYLLWTFMFFGAPAMVFHAELWDVWFGPEYAEIVSAGSIVLVLLFAKALFGFPQPILAQIALAKARNGPMAVRAMTIELSAVFLAYYFVKERGMGPVGVALGTLTATAVGVPLLIWTFGLRLMDCTVRQWTREVLGRGFAPMLAATPVWLAIWYYARPTNWWELGIAGAVGCAVYAAVLVGFCLPHAERAELGRFLFRRQRRTTD